MAEVCSQMGSLAERRPNRRPRRSGSWQAATPRGGRSLDWLGEVTSRLAVTARIDPSATPRIKATAAPQQPLGSGVAIVRQPERLDEMSKSTPRSKPKFTKAYSFGLVTGLFFLSPWTTQFVFEMISERNEATQHAERFTWSEFLPALLFPHLRELSVKVSQLVRASGELAFFHFFWGPLSRGEP